MPTDLCRWCGTAYEIVHGHQCMPTVATTRTNSAHAQMTEGGERDVTVSEMGPATARVERTQRHAEVVGPALDPPTTLQQAIQAATDALAYDDTWGEDERGNRVIIATICQRAARVAVEAAAPILTADLHAKVERLQEAIRDAIPHVPYRVEQDLRAALDQTRERADG